METKNVVTCFLIYKGRVLLLKRSENVRSFKGRWAGVSGYIESTTEDQAYIEIEEETGLKSSDISLIRKGSPLKIHDQDLKTLWIVYPFLFEVKNPQKIRLDWEHKTMKWVPFDEVSHYKTVPKLSEAFNRVWSSSSNNTNNL